MNSPETQKGAGSPAMSMKLLHRDGTDTGRLTHKSKADAPEGLKTSELALGNHCNMTTSNKPTRSDKEMLP